MNVLFLLLRRTFAFLYDSLLLIAVFFIVTAVLLNLTDGRPIQHPSFYALLWVIGGVFFTSFWKRGGQTLGMRAWHLRLIDERAGSTDAIPTQGSTVSLGRLWLRYASGTVLFGVGYLWSVFDTRSRTANDCLSRTEIIKDSGHLKRQA